MKVKIIFLILLIVVVSGCTGQRAIKVDANNGLVINKFDIDPSTLEYTDTADVYLEVENVGGTTASNVVATLYGITWTEPETKTLNKELTPPDIRFSPGVSGGYAVFRWSIKAPKLPEGIEHRYDIFARVSYDYKTTAVANLPAITKAEYKRRKETNTATSEMTITNSNAPIKVDVTAQPIIIDTSPDAPNSFEFPLRISFTNVGSGVPNTDGVDGAIKGSIRLEGANLLGASLVDCIEEGNNIGTEGEVNIRIREGKMVTAPCTLRIDKSAWLNRPEGTLSLIFDLRYGYYVESKTQIKVLGTRYRNE